MRFFHFPICNSISILLVFICFCIDTIQCTSYAFEVIWNAPSEVCAHNCGGLALEQYNIISNMNEQFIGNKVACLYSNSFGLWPTLNATLIKTPCWKTGGKKPCSWTPWGEISVKSNGGVPQAANLTAHLEKVSTDIVAAIPNPTFSGILILDFEEFRPILSANIDALSFNVVYSQELIKKQYPSWQNETKIALEAEKSFNNAALTFFIETIRTIRQLRPHAKIGYYEWPSDSTDEVDDKLSNLYKIVDIFAPSVYPRYFTNVTKQIEFTVNRILEAQRVQKLYGKSTSIVLPYVRALIGNDGQPLNRAMLATQIQIAAGLGTEGIILWGASSDYSSGCEKNGGCDIVNNELKTVAGPLIKTCIENRNNCRQNECSGHGRCVDYDMKRLEKICITSNNNRSSNNNMNCHCDYGWSGNSCNIII